MNRFALTENTRKFLACFCKLENEAIFLITCLQFGRFIDIGGCATANCRDNLPKKHLIEE